MKTSVKGKEERQAERDLFAELSEGMKALADDRMGNRVLSAYAAEPKSKRQQLLPHLPWFVSAATKLTGIRGVALLGSITTKKRDPKDIDFLVIVDDDAELEPLARLGRKIKGRAQQMNRGADIFLANPQGKYIGRTRSWRECVPGIRRSCDALNCGRRHYLHDDLQTVTLSDENSARCYGNMAVIKASPWVTRRSRRGSHAPRCLIASHSIGRRLENLVTLWSRDLMKIAVKACQ